MTDKSTKSENPSFPVVPNYQAVEVTEEYVRNGNLYHTASPALPKFDERTGGPLGVEYWPNGRAEPSRVVQVGDYLIYGPDGLTDVPRELFSLQYRRMGEA